MGYHATGCTNVGKALQLSNLGFQSVILLPLICHRPMQRNAFFYNACQVSAPGIEFKLMPCRCSNDGCHCEPFGKLRVNCAKQSLLFRNKIATACKAGLAMTTAQIACDKAIGFHRMIIICLKFLSTSTLSTFGGLFLEQYTDARW
jgi:hypothetical protein